MKNNKINKKTCFLLVLLLVLGTSFVSAFSVSSPYMENKTLNLFPNSKITDLEFVLQNGGGATEDVTIKVNIIKGSEIINIIDEIKEYLVSPGDKIPVNLRITLPKDVEEGQNYDVTIEFNTVSSEESGKFGIGTGQEQSFKIAIIKDVNSEKELNKLTLILISGILIIIIIAVIFIIKKKKKSNLLNKDFKK